MENLSAEEKVSFLERRVDELTKANNMNAQILSGLMRCLGISIKEENERILYKLDIPRDGEHCGYLSRLCKDVITLKEKEQRIIVPKVGIVP